MYELGTLQADRFEFSAITPLPASDRILEIHVRPRMPKWRFQNGLPVTTVPQTIADLYSEHIDYGHVGIVILDALLASSADFLDITEEMDSITDGSGRAIVLHMLDVVGAPTRLVTALVHLAEMKRRASAIREVTRTSQSACAVTRLMRRPADCPRYESTAFPLSAVAKEGRPITPLFVYAPIPSVVRYRRSPER